MIFLALILVFLTQVYALFFVPAVKWFGPKGEELGIVQKIFYVHVPSAWAGFLGILISAIFGALYLLKRNENYDKLSSSFMEVSSVFVSVGLITGSLWAKPAWGAFWTWDPRLVSMAILLMLVLGYLFFRSLVEEEEIRSRFSAILAIISAINVPIVFFSIRLFKTLHPAVLKGLSTSETYGMDFEISRGLLLNLLSVSLLMLSLALKRYKKI